jgi:hypothetical protein
MRKVRLKAAPTTGTQLIVGAGFSHASVGPTAQQVVGAGFSRTERV